MSRRNLYIIIVTGVIAVAATVILIWLFTSQPKRYMWIEHYQYRSFLKRQPYGLLYFKQLIEKRPGPGRMITIRKPLNRFLPERAGHKGVYLFMGNRPIYSDQAAEELLSFAEKGNTVFIMATNLPETFIKALFVEASFENPFILSLDVSDVNPSLAPFAPDNNYHFWYQVSDQKARHYWGYLNPEHLSNLGEKGKALGHLHDDLINFYEITYGKGRVILHTNPLLFSNYFIITEEGYRYASGAFSFLKSSDNIYLDRVSLKQPSQTGLIDPGTRKSWLGFILTSPGLKWAWYLLLLTVMLIIIVRSRRRQRAIPVMESRDNSVMEHIRTLGQIYLKHKNHRKLALQQKQLLMNKLASRWKIRINRPVEELRDEIIAKTGVPEEIIDKLLEQIRHIDTRQSLSARELTTWYESIEQFYSYSK